MNALALALLLVSTLAVGIGLGILIGRRQLLQLIRRVNAQRQITDQAVGADLLRQVQSSTRRPR